MFFPSIFKKVVSVLVYCRRYLFNKRKQIRNKNETPTLITNNCIGGIIYHDLGLEFRSPTINLFFGNKDFFPFINDIEYYANQEPIEVFEDGQKFPIGELRKGTESIRLYFMHYKTFDEAVEKWKKRAKKIDYNNLFIIFEYPQKLKKTDEIYKEFKSIKHTNKRLITDPVDFEDEEIVKINIYDKNYHPGKIMKYKSKYSPKRYLDDFDYIKFLNKEKTNKFLIHRNYDDVKNT